VKASPPTIGIRLCVECEKQLLKLAESMTIYGSCKADVTPIKVESNPKPGPPESRAIPDGERRPRGGG
jgi:hypothetical protein